MTFNLCEKIHKDLNSLHNKYFPKFNQQQEVVLEICEGEANSNKNSTILVWVEIVTASTGAEYFNKSTLSKPG